MHAPMLIHCRFREVCLITLLVLALLSCGSSAGYYSYALPSEGEPAVRIRKSPAYGVSIHPAVIKELKDAPALSAEIGLSGNYQDFPRGLRLELYSGDTRLESGTPRLTFTTVIDSRVTAIPLEASTEDIAALVQRIKTDKKLPPSLNYFTVGGKISVPLPNPCCPDVLRLKLRVISEKETHDQNLEFRIGKREYGKASNRPFG